MSTTVPSRANETVISKSGRKSPISILQHFMSLPQQNQDMENNCVQPKVESRQYFDGEKVIPISCRVINLVDCPSYKIAWVLNSEFSNCMRCNREFNTFYWRHHCRLCGDIVCNVCTKFQNIPLLAPYESPSRVCAKLCQVSVKALNATTDTSSTVTIKNKSATDSVMKSVAAAVTTSLLVVIKPSTYLSDSKISAREFESPINILKHFIDVPKQYRNIDHKRVNLNVESRQYFDGKTTKSKLCRVISLLDYASTTVITTWVLDSEFSNCMRCNREFDVFCWKHHCRLCGDIVCNLCTKFDNSDALLLSYRESPSRVCARLCQVSVKTLNTATDEKCPAVNQKTLNTKTSEVRPRVGPNSTNRDFSPKASSYSCAYHAFGCFFRR